MLNKLFIAILFLFLSLPVSAGQFKVTSVHDGDSLRATGHDIQIKVRLRRIGHLQLKSLLLKRSRTEAIFSKPGLERSLNSRTGYDIEYPIV